MEFSEREKAEKLKGIIIRRIQNISSLSVLKTMLKSLTWTKIKNFIDQDLDADAERLDINTQDSVDEKANILALKAEKDTF